MRGPRRRVGVGLLALAWIGVGCAGPIVETTDGFRHRKHEYRIAAPDGPGPAWQRVDLEGADLAFRRPGPGTISMQSRCGRPVAMPQLMARHLLIGVPERELVAAGPVQVDGLSGWGQTFDTVSRGVKVRLKTVTLVVRGCTFDWVLAAAGSFDSAEAAFDAWWGSTRLDPSYHAGASE